MVAVNLEERLFRLELELIAYQKLHADELAELWRVLNECKREIRARQGTLGSPTGETIDLAPSSENEGEKK